MAKYKAYPEYKDSGVEWLGEIPTHWDCTALKRLCSLITGLTPPTQNEDNYADEGYPWVRPEDLNESGFGTHASKYVSDIGWKLLRHIKPNSTLICCIGTIGKCGYVKETVSTNQQITAATFRDSERFNYYLLQAARAQLEELATGNVLKILNSERLGALNVVKVNCKEANTIAEFLDHETAKIDNLIEKQQQLIELLKEKRQAVISHAVTKGLNPYVPMKDSGVEWLGEVPAHWDICLLKFKCSAITDGAHISADTNEGKHYFVSIKDIKKGIIDFNNSLLTSSASYKYLVKTGCKPFSGDILFSKDGTIGQTAIVPDDVDFVVASSLIIIRADKEKALPAFMDLLLQSSLVKEQVESFVKGAALRRLSIQNLEKVFGVFPTLSEQLMISDYIYAQLNRLDVLESKAVAQIQLLEERRTALISAAVTGKIDVRDWVAPDTQDIEEPEEATV